MGTEILSPCMNDATLSHELTWLQSLPEIPRQPYGHDNPNAMHSSTSPLTLDRLATPPLGNPLHNTKTQRTPVDLPEWTILSPPMANDGHVAPAETRFRSPQCVGPRTATHQVANGGEVDERTQAASPSSNRTSGSSSKLPQKPLFDGVLISSRPPKSTASRSAGSTAKRSLTPATSFSLLDALQRTFDANNNHLTPSQSEDDASSAPQTDQEAATDDGKVILRHRLSPLKRRSSRRQIAQSDKSEDAAEVKTAFRDGLVKKRVGSIPYDSMPGVIDAALGTTCAPIWLGKEDEFEDDGEAEEMPGEVWNGTRDLSVESDGWSCGIIGDHPLTVLFVRPPLSASSTATLGLPHRKLEKTGFITPHVSMHDRFQQKLHSLFGDNVTVRTDRGARPRENFFDYIYQPANAHHDDTLSHPIAPEANGDGDNSPIDNTPPAPVDSVQASTPVAPMQERTATADSVPTAFSSTSRRSLKRQASQEVDTDAHTSVIPRNDDSGDAATAPAEVTHQPLANKKRRLDFNEDQLQSWTSKLQRLIKGKIRFTEEALKQLSDLLAQIDSVKMELDMNIPIVNSLQQSIRKLSQLQDIPFGDPYKLRIKAHLIATAWSRA